MAVNQAIKLAMLPPCESNYPEPSEPLNVTGGRADRDLENREHHIPPLPPLLPPVPSIPSISIPSAVSKHGLDPRYTELPKHDYSVWLGIAGEQGWLEVETIRTPREELIDHDATHYWFPPAVPGDEGEPGPPSDCVALWLNKSRCREPRIDADVLIVDSTVWGLQCANVPPLRPISVRHPKQNLVGIPLLPFEISYPDHLYDLDEYLYRQDLLWLRTTLLFMQPPKGMGRSSWRQGSEERCRLLPRHEVLKRMRHVFCTQRCAVELGVRSQSLYDMLDEVYDLLQRNL